MLPLYYNVYFWDKTGGSPTLQKDVTTIQRFFTTVVEHFCGLQANSFAPYVMAFLTVVNTYFTQNIYAEIFPICDNKTYLSIFIR